MKKLFFDSESYSECNLKVHGNAVYMADKTTEVMVLQFALENEEPTVIDMTRMNAADVEGVTTLMRYAQEAVDYGTIIFIAHNSFFDRRLLMFALDIDIPVECWRDTMVMALCHGMPGGLDKICQALQLPEHESKDKRGTVLVQLFCKPMAKNSQLRRATRHTHPDQWAEFLEYSRQDIIALRAIFNKLPKFNSTPYVLNRWFLDQTINDRGFYVDMALVDSALMAIATEKIRSKKAVHYTTFGEVDSATQRDKLLEFILNAYGVILPDLTADTVTRRMNDESLPDGVRLLLALRLEAARASTSKYTALRNSVSKDDRLRGTLQFSGASRTMRWAGRIFQPHNLPRPTMPQDLIEAGITALKTGDAEDYFPSIQKLTSNALRGCLIAAPGKKLVWADLSNIEGRMLAWLAGEDWKIKAFIDYDNGIGADLYILSYAKAFSILAELVTQHQRQIGKVQELALGYEGGVAAFITFAAVYNMDLSAMADAVWAITPMAELSKARDVYEWAVENKRALGLEMRIYVACEVIKRAWRRGHSHVTAFWKVTHQAFRDAVFFPGTVIECGKVTFEVEGAWMKVKLPSGRFICYLAPRVNEKGECSYMGVDPYSNQWRRMGLHGGKLVGHITQSAAYDVLADGMLRIEHQHKYSIVLTVHDEIVCEVPDTDDFSAEKLAELFAADVPWAPGLPLAAKGEEGQRYHK